MGLFKKNITVKDIERLEADLNIILPNDYKKEILSLNGKSYARAYILDSQYEELDFSGFISLNSKDERNVYDVYGEVIEDPKYFPFADTDFGDYFCFNLKEKQIVLYLHETGNIIPICDTFTKFLKMLNSKK